MTRLAQLKAAKRAFLAAERAKGINPTGLSEANDDGWIEFMAQVELRSEIQQAHNHASSLSRRAGEEMARETERRAA